MKRIVPVFVMAAGIVALLGALSMALLRGSDVHAIKSLGYPIYMVQNYQFVWGYTAINTLSAALIIGALQGHRLFRVLETPFLVRVGKISYGMYVIHVPCFLLLIKLLHRYSIPMGGLRGLAAFLFYFAAVMVLSEISFRFFEKRFLALKDRAFVFRRDAAPTHG